MSSSPSTSGTNIGNLPPVARLEAALGYRFSRPELLDQALTHKSFAKPHNERLEFLGDAVLGCVVADRLYEARPTAGEDDLTLLRASLVRKETLAELAAEVGLGGHLRLGPGERRSGGHKRASILADALEGIIGAVYLDGGFDAARGLVLRLLEPRMQSLHADDVKDAKTRLQEHLQGRNLALPDYSIRETSGSAHARVFTVVCRVDAYGLEVVAEGKSRRAAEKNAAARMLDALQEHASEHEKGNSS